MTKYFNVGDQVYVAQADLFDNSMLNQRGVIKGIYQDTKRALVSFGADNSVDKEIDLCVLEK